MLKKQCVRLILCLICLSLLVSGLVACKEEADKPKPSVTQEKPTTPPTPSDDEDEEWFYTAPNVNYNGEEFNIYTWAQAKDWVLTLDEGTTTIDAATYTHYASVEQELGIVLNIAQSIAGDFGGMDMFIGKIAALTGDDEIDIVCQYSLAASYGVTQGLYVNLNELPYINWEAPYWSSDLKEANTINGKMYYCTGELSRSVIYNMYVMAYNYTTAQNLGMENLYDLVDSGEWTMDKLNELTKGLWQDKNQSGVKDAGDEFGLVIINQTYYDALHYGCDLHVINKDANGELQINPRAYGEYGDSITEKITALALDHPDNFTVTEEGGMDQLINKEAVFQVQTIDYVINHLNKSDTNYGILPMPKYDTAQKNYYTCLNMRYSMYSIPVAANDYDKSAAFLESAEHNGWAVLTPFLFEECIQSRMAKRPEDAKMFDILRDGIVYEPGRILGTVTAYSFIRGAVFNREKVGSKYERKYQIFKDALNDINVAYS